MAFTQIDTPAMLVDLDRMEANLRRVASYAQAHALRLRPHTKTHKSPVIARKQLALGAAGLTVAKLGEAEVLVNGLADLLPIDLLIAFPIVGAAKLRRLAALARRTPVTVALDSMEVARELSECAVASHISIGVLVEFDAGLGRVGVTPDQLLPLAIDVARLPGLRLRGITFYPGHIKDAVAGAPQMECLRHLLSDQESCFRHAGVPLEIISGGSTPTLFHSHQLGPLNEIRPGTYVYEDLNTVESGACTLDDCAAYVLATVVSTPRLGHIVIDGGSKTFSSDRPAAARASTFGRVLEAPGCAFHKMNEEHGFIDTSASERAFAVGDRMRIIPNHVCVAMNLHERVYGVRGGQVETVWDVEGRGKLQ